ncbi:hypothetical protein Q5P01_000063 [Channa striata]|uniref:Uncharacterized protein n=1 Tax=Channa striata TaxID=64152 RepID=A0AA88IKA6_CHASR|nr:hypothetical protein Q5P01_000063 [Channa striata]
MYAALHWPAPPAPAGATADPLVPCLLSAKYRMLLGMYAAKGRPLHELARAVGDGSPERTFNTMKLEPAAEVRTRRAQRQVGRDHRWYAAAGHHQDPGLDRWFQETPPQHDMHGSVREILRDLNDNPAPRLRWLLEYVVNLNAPSGRRSHSRPIRDGGARRYTHHNGCARGCRRCAGRRRLLHGSGPGGPRHGDKHRRAAGTQDQEQRRPGRRHPVALQHAAVADLTMFSPRTRARSDPARTGDNQTRTSTVTIRSCMRPTVSKTPRDKFPWLNCLCPQVLNCLTPAMRNMRVGTRLNWPADGRRRKRSGVDPSDLCFRNMMFNQEKARVSPLSPREERRN